MIEDNILEQGWPFVSVIIVNYNGRIWLEKFLDSVLHCRYPQNRFEIILVDNGSHDGSIEYVKNKCEKNSKMKIVSIKENVGWARAVNLGFKKARGEVLVHISSDVQVSSEWLQELVKAIKSDPAIAIAQCNSISYFDRHSIDSGMNFIDKYGFSYSFASPNKDPQEVFFAEALAFGIRRSVLKLIGLFDENYYMEYDDQDICWRAHLAGFKVVFVPTAVVYHVRGGSVGRSLFESFPTRYLYSRNQIITMIKNYELKNLVTTIPVTVSIASTKIIYSIIIGKSIFALSTLRGLLTILKFFKPIFLERKRIQEKVRKVPDSEVLRKMTRFNLSAQILFLELQARRKRLIMSGI